MKISSRGAKRVREGHLWVYRSDVSDANGVEGGAIARVVDQANNLVGQAFYSDASEIALRFLTTRDETIGHEWWRVRLRACAERRASVARDTNAYRLVYSEGDLLPSLIVDKYDEVLVMQTLSQGTERLKVELSDLLIQEFQPRAIVERNDGRVRQLEGLETRIDTIYGEAHAEIEINQNGVRFFISPLGGQKTGAFLDQRENYQAAARLAHGRALDCFTFNGGFALHLSHACQTVLGIDISDAAVAAALRLESALHFEILVRLLRSEIAVLFRQRLAENLGVIDRPAFGAVVLPARQILAVEERDPALVAALS